MKTILSIETSCDETTAAITKGRRIFSNVIYSQIELHSKWGGVVPHLAKREHEAKIEGVISEAIYKYARNKNLFASELARLRRAQTSTCLTNFITSLACIMDTIDYIAITQGPGLAPALEVGIRLAKQLAKQFDKKLIAVSHMEGHIYSCFAQNSKGNPKRDFKFPILALLVSGGHTEIVLMTDHLQYQIIGETIDDAAGEALDKASKMLGLGYPGGSVIERLAEKGDPDFYHFPRPMMDKKNPDFSFSGLKTSLFYYLKKLSEKERMSNLENIAASYQQAVFDVLSVKFARAVEENKVRMLCAAGGVSANKLLRKNLRGMTKKTGLPIYFPAYKSLYGDNAAMIGVAAHFKSEKNLFVKNFNNLDRRPSLKLGQQI